jgi:rare lipoprotein A
MGGLQFGDSAPLFEGGADSGADAGPSHRSLSGDASYYETGRTTAYGEPFDPEGMTAAMADRALRGKDVTVRLADQPERSVKVRINDRGPWAKDENGQRIPHPTRIIDLSRGAFRQLTGGLQGGTAKVEVLIPDDK